MKERRGQSHYSQLSHHQQYKLHGGRRSRDESRHNQHSNRHGQSRSRDSKHTSLVSFCWSFILACCYNWHWMYVRSVDQHYGCWCVAPWSMLCVAPINVKTTVGYMSSGPSTCHIIVNVATLIITPLLKNSMTTAHSVTRKIIDKFLNPNDLRFQLHLVNISPIKREEYFFVDAPHSPASSSAASTASASLPRPCPRQGWEAPRVIWGSYWPAWPRPVQARVSRVEQCGAWPQAQLCSVGTSGPHVLHPRSHEAPGLPVL